MFRALINTPCKKDFRNVFSGSSKILASHSGCSGRASHTRRQYCFDHGRKGFSFDSKNKYFDQSQNSQSLAENKESEGLVNEQTKVVTKERFQEINSQLANDSPFITSLEIDFALTEAELIGLYNSIQNNTELGYVAWHKDQFPFDILNQINTKLIEHNKNYKYHPNDYVHGLLSKHAYKNSLEGDSVTLDPNIDVHLKNWRVEKIYNDTQNSGYYGVIYVNDKTHQVVLANRGTEDIIKGLFSKNSDWKTNLEEILGQKIGDQQARNYQATGEAINIAKNKGYRLSLTGHSLGAWLAELSAFYSHAYFECRNIKAVTFDSPGTVPMMEKLQSNIRGKDTRIELEDIEIVTYLAQPNPANCCNPHVGRVYRVPVKMKQSEKVLSQIPTAIDNMFGNKIRGVLTIEGHFLSGILETFDPATGKPRSCDKMLDWPRVEYSGAGKAFASEGMAMIKDGINSSGIHPMGQMALSTSLDYIIGGMTIITIVGFLKSYVKGEIKQDQYWTYFENIDFKISNEDEISYEERTKLTFDNRFTLIALAKYREGKNVHNLKLNTDSVDKYLYKLYDFKEKLGEQEDLLPIVKTQLEELLASFKINRNGQQNTLIPNAGYDIDGIREKTQRLLQVLPKDVRKVWQKVLIHKPSILQIGQLPDNLPLATANYTVIQDKEKELKDKLAKDQIVVISGIGGMGKSTLAKKCGYDYKQQIGWKVRWIKGTQIDQEFFTLAKDLNIITDNLRPEEIRNIVYGGLERLPKKQILLIFDNVEETEKIEQYLMNLPNHVKVVITTRQTDLLKGIEAIKVEGFSEEKAKIYLKAALGKNESEVGKFVNTVGQSPFRLDKVVAYFNKHKLTNVDDYIKEYDKIKKGRSQNEEIYPEVELLFRDLKEKSPESWRLLKYLAYLDAEGVPLELISNIMGKPLEDLEKCVNDLEKLSLMKAINEDNKQILKVSHRIVQEETKKALKEEDQTQSQEILEKLIKEVDQGFPMINENPEDWGKVMGVVSHAKMLIEETKEINQTDGRANLLSKIGAYFYYINFNYGEAINYWEELLKHQRNIHTANHPDVASSLDNVGLAYQDLGGTENVKIGLQNLEKALKMRQALYPGNNSDVARSLNNVGRAYEALGGTVNVKIGLQNLEKALKMWQALYPDNNSDVACSLNNVGLAYKALGGAVNVKKGLEYQEASLKMWQKLHPGSHIDVATSLNNVGRAYEALGGEGNVKKGLEHLEESLKMIQELFPGNHPDVAISLDNVGVAYKGLGGEENVKKGRKYQEASMKMWEELFSGNRPDVAISLDNLGRAYEALGGVKNVKRGPQYLEASLNMRPALYPGNRPDVAVAFDVVGRTYEALGETKNLIERLQYLEVSLKMVQALFFVNHASVAILLSNVGLAYRQFDVDKALEYLKQAYGINSSIFNEDYTRTKEIKSAIESLQPDFFLNQGSEQSCLGGNRVGPECRWILTSRQTMNDELLTLKQGIQESILNKIVNAAENYGWTNIGWFGSDWGVKGYLGKDYLKKALKELGSENANIETAQMLCFESMNLGIMKSAKKPYSIVQEFTRNNPELVKKIAIEHPEFFVDGSIVESCVKAMPNDKAFEEHIFEHVKYMGEEERKSQREAA